MNQSSMNQSSIFPAQFQQSIDLFIGPTGFRREIDLVKGEGAAEVSLENIGNCRIEGRAWPSDRAVEHRELRAELRIGLQYRLILQDGHS